MQVFLDANPRYWRFVPMTIDESERECERAMQPPVFSVAPDSNQRSVDESLRCVESTPTPSSGLIFSRRQIMLQTQFFYNKRDLDLPRSDVDLYDASIATVRKYHVVIE